MPRKTTKRLEPMAKNVIRTVANTNAPRMQRWLDEIYKTDGARAAMDTYIKLLEFVLPKVGRMELTGEDGGAIKGAITFSFVPLPAPHASKTIDVTPGKRDA
jgi:hypothetical protein